MCLFLSFLIVEVKSVYVRNVPTTMDPSEIEEEFKKFGKLKPDGVAIRTRKVCSFYIFSCLNLQGFIVIATTTFGS